jgi:hypothetical protein
MMPGVESLQTGSSETYWSAALVDIPGVVHSFLVDHPPVTSIFRVAR